MRVLQVVLEGGPHEVQVEVEVEVEVGVSRQDMRSYSEQGR